MTEILKCPFCGNEGGFLLIEESDVYQDGFVLCPKCDKEIGSFNFSYELKTLDYFAAIEEFEELPPEEEEEEIEDGSDPNERVMNRWLDRIL